MNQDETFDLRPSSLPGCGWRCGSTAQDVAGVQKKSLYMASNICILEIGRTHGHGFGTFRSLLSISQLFFASTTSTLLFMLPCGFPGTAGLGYEASTAGSGGHDGLV